MILLKITLILLVIAIVVTVIYVVGVKNIDPVALYFNFIPTYLIILCYITIFLWLGVVGCTIATIILW